MESSPTTPKWLSNYKDKEKRKKYHREYQRKYMALYRKTHPNYKPNRSDYQKRLREKTIEVLGGPKCVNCGCTINEILEINHIKGDGRKERKKYKNYHSFFRDIIKRRINIEEYNILCLVCNAKHYVEEKVGIKGYEIKFRPNNRKENL